MDGKKNNIDPDRPQRIADLALNCDKECEHLRQYHRQAEEDYRYAEKTYRTVSNKMRDCHRDSPSLKPIEEDLKRRFAAFSEQKERLVALQPSDVSSGAYVAGTATLSISVLTPPESDFWILPPPRHGQQETEKLAHQLRRIHPDLEVKFRAVWKTLRAGGDDTGRQALTTMRSLVDQFIHSLAPEGEVEEYIRKTSSGATLLTENGKPSRRAFLLYVASCKCKNKEKAKVLVDDAGTFLTAYGDLNELHNPAFISEKKAENILTAMQITLSKWLDLIA